MSEQVIIDGELSLDSAFDGLPNEQIIVNVTGAPKIIDKASGKIVSIVDGAENEKLLNAVVNIEPVQSGSGDSSPTNIRPISGWSEVNVWVKPTYDTTLTPTAIISLGQTVYGGTLDVLAGKLTITKVHKPLKDLTISLNTTYPNTFNLTGATDRKVEANVTTEISNVYKMYTSTGIGGEGVASGFAFSNTSTTIFVRDARATTGTELLNLLTSEGSEVVYRLATPIEVDLTPQTIKTLLGTNNIWSDAGNMEVEYVADTKLYIQRLTAPTEDDMIANENIASGKFFMVGNDLYLSTAAIVAGETIAPGTNCTKLSLAEALNNINA